MLLDILDTSFDITAMSLPKLLDRVFTLRINCCLEDIRCEILETRIDTTAKIIKL